MGEREREKDTRHRLSVCLCCGVDLTVLFALLHRQALRPAPSWVVAVRRITAVLRYYLRAGVFLCVCCFACLCVASAGDGDELPHQDQRHRRQGKRSTNRPLKSVPSVVAFEINRISLAWLQQAQ